MFQDEPGAMVFSRKITLTMMEERLLRALYDRRGTVVARDALSNVLWPQHPPAEPRVSLDQHLKNLRLKLGRHGAHLIETLRGRGLRLRFLEDGHLASFGDRTGNEHAQ
jgi:DNA-binding winged helix-turn-helix (wHTH) protein